MWRIGCRTFSPKMFPHQCFPHGWWDSGCFPLLVFVIPGYFPLPILLHEDGVLDTGIIFRVSMVKKCSTHQILLCYH